MEFDSSGSSFGNHFKKWQQWKLCFGDAGTLLWNRVLNYLLIVTRFVWVSSKRNGSRVHYFEKKWRIGMWHVVALPLFRSWICDIFQMCDISVILRTKWSVLNFQWCRVRHRTLIGKFINVICMSTNYVTNACLLLICTWSVTGY